MKRTPLKRTSSLRSRTPVKRRNPKRQKSEFQRAYGGKARVEWVKARVCMACLDQDCEGPIENAHVGNGGAGRKADARFIVPLCRRHHRLLRSMGARIFGRAYRTDLDYAARLTEQRWQEHLQSTRSASDASPNAVSDVALQETGDAMGPAERIAEIEARLAEATPAPWGLAPSSIGGAILLRGAEQPRSARHKQSHLQIVPLEDAELIANAPADIAFLLGELRASTDTSEASGAERVPSRFPDTIYVSLDPDEGGAETLSCAFAAEDLEAEGPVAVYELKSVGRVERRFVAEIEQQGPCPIEDVSAVEA